MTAQVVTIGEAMLALRAPGILGYGAQLNTSIAGAESNVAIGLSRLGHSVRWVGRIGDDQPGAVIESTLRAEEVDTVAVIRDQGSTGIILFEQRMPAVTRVSYARSGSAGSRLCPADIDISADTTILHCTGITPALSGTAAEAISVALSQAAERGVQVSLDINYRSRLWSRQEASAALLPLLPHIDILIGSPDELALLSAAGDQKEIVADLLAAGVSEVVVKDGGGVASVADGARTHTATAYQAQVIDPVGAGDAFVAGYLSAVLDGLEPAERLRRGHALGAFAVTSIGDWEGLPTRAELPLIMANEGQVLR